MHFIQTMKVARTNLFFTVKQTSFRLLLCLKRYGYCQCKISYCNKSKIKTASIPSFNGIQFDVDFCFLCNGCGVAVALCVIVLVVS